MLQFVNNITVPLCHNCMQMLGWGRVDDGCHTAQLKECPCCGETATILPIRHWRMRIECSIYERVDGGYSSFITDVKDGRLLYASEGDTMEQAEANVWKIRFDTWNDAWDYYKEYMGS